MANIERERSARSARKGSGLAGGAGVLFLLSKGKAVLLLLLKLGKPLLSMAVTVGAYALIYPWTFAVGIVALLLFHELGHVWVARRKGVPVSAPYFVPFFGAMVILKRNPKDAETEADIALGGPLLGSAAAFVCYGIGEWTNSPVWHMLAYVGFFINLLNLIPMYPLDGAKIAAALSRWLWVAGVILGPVAMWYTHSFLFVLLWAMFLWETYRKFKRDRNGGAPHFAEGVYHTEADPLLPDWYYRGSDHLRELPYTAYCRMDGQHVVEFQWEALSFKGELAFDHAVVIRKVYGYRIEGPDEAGQVMLRVRAEGVLYEPENYYDVPKRAKWRIGILYGGLVFALLYMMWSIQQAGWTHPG